jgi:hypothetical protein
MEANWATENLQAIRTLMERSAIYRRALAPIMIYNGLLGTAGALAGSWLKIGSRQGFILFWSGLAIAALAGSFVLVRRQALKDSEAFWSPPTRRVAQALLPPLFIGMLAGVFAAFYPGFDFVSPWGLPALWMLLYGCALNAAGFFMVRGIKLFGWFFILSGCVFVAVLCWTGGPLALVQAHAAMGTTFGALHLAYGVYLYFTEKGKNAA